MYNSFLVREINLFFIRGLFVFLFQLNCFFSVHWFLIKFYTLIWEYKPCCHFSVNMLVKWVSTTYGVKFVELMYLDGPYKGTYSCAYQLVIAKNTTKHIKYVIQCVEQLIALQMKPVLVFNGITPDMKLPEENRRRESRAKYRENAKTCPLWCN